MADEPAHNPLQDVYFFITFLVIVVILWYASDGPSRADLRGIFLAPPEPLGTGEAYNPQFPNETVPPPEQVQY